MQTARDFRELVVSQVVDGIPKSKQLKNIDLVSFLSNVHWCFNHRVLGVNVIDVSYDKLAYTLEFLISVGP